MSDEICPNCKVTQHELGNYMGKASAFDQLREILRPYLAENQNWLTTAHLLIQRMTKAEAEAEKYRVRWATLVVEQLIELPQDLFDDVVDQPFGDSGKTMRQVMVAWLQKEGHL